MLLLHLGHHGRFFFQSIPGTFTDITSWLLSCLVYFCASSGVMQSEQGIPLRPLPSVRILSLAFQRACWNVAPADCRYFFTARWRAALLFGGIFWIFFFFFLCCNEYFRKLVNIAFLSTCHRLTLNPRRECRQKHMPGKTTAPPLLISTERTVLLQTHWWVLAISLLALENEDAAGRT